MVIKMEIKNNLVLCPKGHYYNAAVHTSCPICASQGAQGSFSHTEAPTPAPAPTPTPGGFTPTEAPTPAATPTPGGFAPTEAPINASIGTGGVTQPAGNWGSGGVNPFSSPTVLAGDDMAGPSQVDPVVGWVVCIEGPCRGTDFRLHAGYNYIGREAGDIHIQGDNQISREKHAMVAYYHKNRMFYAGPTEGRNIIEINGEAVFNATQLKDYDVITVGSTKLLFLGLCGDKFAWGQES